MFNISFCFKTDWIIPLLTLTLTYIYISLRLSICSNEGYFFCNQNISFQKVQKIIFLFVLFSIAIFIMYYTKSLNSYLFELTIKVIVFIELLFIFITDVKYLEISHISLLLLFILNVPLLIMSKTSTISSFLIGISLFIVFLIIYVFANIGAGDVKLSFFLGIYLAESNIISFFIYTFFLGGIFALCFFTYSKINKKDFDNIFPFAPFMILGFLISQIS